MLKLGLNVICVIAICVASHVQAEEKDQRGDRKAAALKEFDKDGDGKLNEQERNAARAAIAKRRGQNAGGKGKGQPARGRINKEELLKKFDKDGDGQLNAQERTAVREYMAKMQRGQGQGKGRPSREELLKKFDKDGDGQLNAQERQAAMKELGAQKGQGVGSSCSCHGG